MSAKKTSMVKQAAILALAGLLVRFMGFLYRFPLTNLIGDAGNGIYAQGYYIYTFLLILSSAGLPVAISKMVSERATRGDDFNAYKVFRVSLIVSAALGFVAALVLWFGAKGLSDLTGSPDSWYSIRTLAPTVFIVAVMSVFRGYFQGMKNTVPTAVSQIVEQIFNAVFSVFLAYILVKQSVALGAAGGTAGTGIGALAGFLCIIGIYFLLSQNIQRKVNACRTKAEPFSKIAKELLATAFPVIVGAAIFSATNIIDMAMVMSRLTAFGAYTKDQAEVLYGQLSGKYVVLSTLPVGIVTAIATVVVPNIASSRVRRDKADLSQKITFSLKIATLISVPSAVGFGVLGNQILAMLFRNYPGGGILLQVGSASIVFLGLTQITTGVLQGMNRVAVPAVAALCGALVKIPLNYFLISIPNINVIGAVISTTACYAVASAIDLAALKRTSGIKLDWANVFVKPLLAAAVMGLSCYAIYYVVFFATSNNILSCTASILIGIAVYFAYLFVLGGITEQDLLSAPKGASLVNACKRFGLL